MLPPCGHEHVANYKMHLFFFPINWVTTQLMEESTSNLIKKTKQKKTMTITLITQWHLFYICLKKFQKMITANF